MYGAHNPCKGVKRHDERLYRRKRALSRVEEARLFEAIFTDELRSMVTVLLHTGMRRGELLALQVGLCRPRKAGTPHQGDQDEPASIHPHELDGLQRTPAATQDEEW